MKSTPVKSAAQVRQEFERRGETFSEWAVKRGFPPGVVSDLLNNRTKAKRGMAHKVAVALGMKEAA